MNAYIPSLKSLIAGFLAALFSVLGMGIAHAADIAQVPLFVSTAAVNPNILFILDDSGSMQFEGPEGFMGSNYAFVFPRGNTSIYGGSDYSNVVAIVGDNEPYNAFIRSYANNPFYYNPAITYKPWSKADGTLYPNASITSAYHNPEKTAKGGRNFTVSETSPDITWRKCTADNSCNSDTSGKKTFWPATYFKYNGGDKWAWNSYSKFEIKSGKTYSGEGRENRTDDGCTNGTCSYDAEIQNFANWYTYYRSRVLAARAGIGRAFAKQNESLRVGFSTINTMNSGSNYLKAFNQDGRSTFLNSLYGCNIPAQGTPLRKALGAAGQHFSRTDSAGPWADVPGTASGTTYSCRRSYTILMTDGYWNGDGASGSAANNNDGTDGPTVTGPDGKSYTYSAVSPFKDGNSGTLADVAMYYWKNDLHTTLGNNVPTSPTDPAFWQHMVTFGVAFGVEGVVKKEDAFAALLDKEKAKNLPAWPKPAADSKNNVDDLLHAAVNSRGGYFSAKEPEVFANELSGLLQEIVARQESSASSLSSNSTYAKVGTVTYQAKFNSDGWNGQVSAYPIKGDGTLDSAKWTTDQAGKIPAHGIRNIYTMQKDDAKDDDIGVQFEWASLDTTQQTALKTLNGVLGNDTLGQQRLNWIRGDRSQEKQNGGALRQRDKLLGDIVNSNPLLINGVLYVGANDGMLHAFDAENGVEKFAYIPKAVIPNLSMLPDPNYTHQYYVDGSPVVQTFDDGGTSKTILVGTTGAGGRSIFALDITDPNSFAEGKVLWEFNNSNSSDLGYTIPKPVIGQLKNGTWVVIFGNGYHSDSGKAFLFILNLKTGAVIAKISTNDSTNNGLSEPSILVNEYDNSALLLYAGDLQGNMWKFKLGNDGSGSSVAFSVKPLFTAKNGDNIAQPITAAPAIGRHPQGGYMVYFGTGKYFEVGDHSPTGIPVQSVYGIWDTTDPRFSSAGSAITVTNRSVLEKQEILGEESTAGNNWRITSQNTVNYGTLTSPTKRGWYIDLVVKNGTAKGERVTVTPRLDEDIDGYPRISFTTRLPFNADDPCIPSVGTTFFMSFSALTGARFASSNFDVNRDNSFSKSDMILFNGELVVVSGFESVAAGMSQAMLLQKQPGVLDVLFSGTTDATTSASSMDAADKPETKAAAAAAAEAAAAAQAKSEAAQAKQAAAAAAAEAAAAAQDDAAKQQAKTDAENAANAANKDLAQAVVAAANAVMTSAQAIIDADPTGGGSARKAAIKVLAETIKNSATPYISSGNALPANYLADLQSLAAELQGEANVGVRFAGLIGNYDGYQTWRQLR